MKKLVIFFLCILIYSIGCAQTVKDLNGNVYKTIEIGNQTWMAENLRSTSYQNGDPLVDLSAKDDWTNSMKSGYCYYNDTLNSYGLVYKYNVIYDNRNVCPKGWRIPSSNDFKILSDYFGGKKKDSDELANVRLNSSAEWIDTFYSKLYGLRSSNGNYSGYGICVSYWVKDDEKLPRSLFVSPSSDNYVITGVAGYPGYYIRCIKE